MKEVVEEMVVESVVEEMVVESVVEEMVVESNVFGKPLISLQNPEPLFLKMYPLQLNDCCQVPDGQNMN